MPTKLGNGGTSQEAYNPQDGRYTDEGNISQEEAQAMNMMGLGDYVNWDEIDSMSPEEWGISEKNNKSAINSKDFDDEWELLEESNEPIVDPKNFNDNWIPWDWGQIHEEHFDVSGLEKNRLGNLLYDFKPLMKRVSDYLYNNRNSSGGFQTVNPPTNEERKLYNQKIEQIKKYLPYFNKDKYNKRSSKGLLEDENAMQELQNFFKKNGFM
jgi:hypothetical protein